MNNFTPRAQQVLALARKELERSLERLKTDHFDLYQLHWPTDDPVETDAAWQALEGDRPVRREAEGELKPFRTRMPPEAWTTASRNFIRTPEKATVSSLRIIRPGLCSTPRGRRSTPTMWRGCWPP